MWLSKIALLLGLTTVAVSSLLFAPASAADDHDKPISVKLEGTWVCVGDSITEGGGASKPEKGYVGRLTALAKEAGKSVTLTNAGLSGWSTQSFVDNAKNVVAKVPEDAAVITIMLGTNDAHEDGTPAKIAEKASANMEKLIGLYQARAPHAQIVLLAPPAVYPDRLTQRLKNAHYDDKTPAKLAAITDAYKTLAGRLKIRFVDLSTLPSAENSADGVHPNDAGHDEFAKALWKELNS
jgi:lysophospholipase L1-like esterase